MGDELLAEAEDAKKEQKRKDNEQQKVARDEFAAGWLRAKHDNNPTMAIIQRVTKNKSSVFSFAVRSFLFFQGRELTENPLGNV